MGVTGAGRGDLHLVAGNAVGQVGSDPVATRWTPDGTLLWCSKSYARLVGRPVEELVGTLWPDAAAVVSRTGKTWSHLRRIVRHLTVEGGDMFTSDEALPAPHGRRMWLRWVEWPFRDPVSGELEMVLSVAFDVSNIYEAQRVVADQVDLQQKVRKRDMELVAEHLHLNAVQDLVAARWVLQAPVVEPSIALELVDRALETTRSSVGVLGDGPGAVPAALREAFVAGTASAVVDGWLRPNWLTDSLVEAITVLTPERLLWWSPSSEVLFGRSAFEFGLDWSPLLHPDDVGEVSSATALAMRGVASSLTWRFEHPVRGELVISSRFVPLPDIDGMPAAAITSMDVTEVATARQEAAAVASVWADVVKGLPFAVVLVADDGTPVEGNAEARRLFASQLGREGESGWGPTPRLWARQVDRLVARAAVAAEPFEWEFPSLGTLTVDVLSRQVLLAPGRPGRVVLIRDVSAAVARRRRAEEELGRWRALVESFVVAFAVVRIADDAVLAFNRVACEMFEVEFDEVSGVLSRDGVALGSLLELMPQLGLDKSAVADFSHAARLAPNRTEVRVVRVELPSRGWVWLSLHASLVTIDQGDVWVLSARDVSPEQEAFSRVELLNDELAATVAGLERVRARERELFAARIHDDGLQRVSSLMWEARNLDAPSEQREELLSGLRGLESALRAELSFAFAPVEELGLAEALRVVCEASPVAVELVVSGDLGRVGVEAARLVVRTVRESLRNVELHAGPASCVVRVALEGDRVVVSVVDDGSGFDVAQLSGAPRAGHFGVVSMRESVREAGGRFEVVSTLGSGTSVVFWLPVATP